MPGVWNVNNGYNINTKKVSSKLTFEVGEQFTGRIVSKGDGKDVTIKLGDGWQFIAELEGDVNTEDIKLVKFTVDGFEDGKLKLKIAQESGTQESVSDENFQEIIKKEGLSKEDINILKKMVESNIALTKENINQIKGLFQFNEKISFNPKEIDAFIQTYLQSKNISADSEQGKAIKELLTKFLDEFKNLTKDDILSFIENNLDFSEENINSFNKLFKGNSSIEQILTKINESINDMDTLETKPENNVKATVNNLLNNKEVELVKNLGDTNSTLASKAYNENDKSANKINIVDVLKTLAGNDDSELNLIQKNAAKEIVNANIEKLNLSEKLINKLEEPEVMKTIKDTIGSSLKNTEAPKTQAERLIDATNRMKLESLLTKIEGKEVKFTDSEFNTFKQLINNKVENKETLQQNTFTDKTIIQPKEASVSNTAKEAAVIKENTGKFDFDSFLKSNLDNNKEVIKAGIKDKIDNIRDIVKNLVDQVDTKGIGYEKIMNLVKENINDFKVFNSVSNEYYYLNVPVTLQNQEYPCKLIIKDNRKDGKKIDSTNAKMVVSIKTINLGEVDGYLTMKENKIDVNIKCDSQFTSVINNNKSKLVDGLSTLGMFVNVRVSAKEKPVDLVSCRKFFNDLSISAIDIKV